MLLYSIAQEVRSDITSLISPEQVFGGAILILLLWLIMNGKIRLEREIEREQNVVKIHEETIQKQRATINALVSKDRETLHLLKELRAAAIARGDLHYTDLIDEQMGNDHE